MTSIDYSKMSEADKLKITRDRITSMGSVGFPMKGDCRVFYEVHGHDERIYAMTPMLEHLLAGTQ